MEEFAPSPLEELQSYIRFIEILSQLRIAESRYKEDGKLDCTPISLKLVGSGHYLKFNLDKLLGKEFLKLSIADEDSIFRRIVDKESSSVFHISPSLCGRPCLLKNSILVNKEGKVNVNYKVQNENTPTTETYPFPPAILTGELPELFTISRSQLFNSFKLIREEVIRTIVSPISKATGYKWQYRESGLAYNSYFMIFNCFQDINSKVNNEFEDPELLKTYKRCDCGSSLQVGISLLDKQCIISYSHTPHTKLVDIVYSLLASIYAK